MTEKMTTEHRSYEEIARQRRGSRAAMKRMLIRLAIGGAGMTPSTTA